MRHFIGLVLIVVGVLWLATTGLCTLWFLSFVADTYQLSFNDIGMVIFVGGSSALFGGIIYASGRWLRPKKS